MSLTARRFAINQATTRSQWTLAESIVGFAHEKVHGIAIWPDKLAECGVPQAQSLLLQHSMTVTGYCCGDLFDTRDAAALRRSLSHARRRVDEAAALSAQCLVAVVGGTLAPGNISSLRARAEEGLAELLPYAAAAGMPLAIEPIHPMRGDISIVNTLAQANAMCDRLGPGTGVVVDTYHVWWDPEIASAIAAARGRILAFHLADWLLPTTDIVAGRGMIGDGIVDIPGIAAMVEAAGYRGFYEIEVMSRENWWRRPGAEVVATCVNRLQQLATSMSGAGH